ncbi:integrase [Bacillus pseudomycoides]|uniref:tyrosine-type recombinase/integrase n=1 Tax=Bacillus pseudomycoides TaxID=64104 RepID=UPI000BEDC970|nr:site-specific integrase [Bacillus pseudomycoides]PEA84050.1 integrase [Bacillus pseudomycoides]PEK26262.1 integrase [Bacillus pseudomycoides]PEO14170.1 integrase [Bacillus pseudomycoides]PEP60637.1 integrase [Bacillus pseudomycoides]PFW67481.1 integrase [Bacillus pseudomycoides]
MTWDLAVDIFLSDLLKHGRKPSTVKQYRYDISLFTSWIQKRVKSPPGDVLRSFDVNVLDSYLKWLKREREASISSVKRVRGILINFLQFHGAANSLKSDVAPPGLTSKHFASDEEIQKLLRFMQSYDGLTEYQASGRKFILERNLMLVRFMLNYGLSIQDIITLSMHDIHFGTNTIKPGGLHAYKRSIILSKEDVKLALLYYKKIPKLIRPRQQTGDPFFVAFDFAPQTFRWDYEKDQPAALTRIAVQRMLQKETKRAKIHVTPTMLRNRFVLDALQNGINPQEIKVFLGLKSVEALHRYIQFLNKQQQK